MGGYAQVEQISTFQEQEELVLSDAHCHLNLFKNPREVIDNAVNFGIKIMITSGGNDKDNREAGMLCNGPHVFGVVGISPDFAQEAGVNFSEKLAVLIKGNRNIVGVGEVGLDFKITNEKDKIEVQKNIFLKQIQLAKELDVPLVIHARGAIENALDMVIENGVEKAMFHFFEGGVEEAKVIERRGYLISIPPLESKRRIRVIQNVALDCIVAETDAPAVGKDPTEVRKSLEIIAKARGIDFAEAAQSTTDNLRKFFYI